MICEDLSMRPIGPQNARTIPCAQGIFRQIIAPLVVMTSPIEDRNIILLGLSQHGKSAYLNQLLVTQKSASPQCAIGKGYERCTTEPQLVELHPPQRPTQILATDALPEPPETLLYQCLASLQGHADLAEKKPEGEALLRMQREMWEWLSKLRPGLVLSYSANVRFSHPLVTSSPEVQPECDRDIAVCLFRKHCADPVIERLLQSKETKAKRNQGAEQELRIKALDTPGLEDSQGKDDENVLKIIEAARRLQRSASSRYSSCKSVSQASRIE